MPEYVIKPGEVARIIWSYRKSMAVLFVVAVGLVFLTYRLVPRVYKTEAVIHISGNYFQNPLLGDLVSQIFDPAEVREERAKIIRSSLGEKFANEADEKYKLFKAAPNDPDRALEIESFLKSVEMFSITATQFKIRVSAPTPASADGLIRDTIDSVRKTMYLGRTRMLEDLLEVLSTEISRVSSGGLSASSPIKAAPAATSDGAKAQIAVKIDGLVERLNDLRTSYNDQHPAVQKVKAEISRLRAMSQGRMASDSIRSGLLGDGKGGPRPESGTKDELARRMHLVNMSYEMEKKDPTMAAYLSIVEEPKFPRSPAFPKPRVFLIVALIAGLMAALSAVAFGEYWKRMRLDPSELARSLNAEVLGALILPPARGQSDRDAD